MDTTSIDNAAFALEDKSYFVRKVGSDGFKISHQPTLKKVVSDRRASLDEESEIKPTMRRLVEEEFRRGATVPIVPFPADGSAVQDTPNLTLVVMDPTLEWTGDNGLRSQIEEWMRVRGKSPRLYPGSLVWCVKKPGRDLRDNVEMWLAWRKVAREVSDGTLGGDFERSDRAEIQTRVSTAEDDAKDEVWGGYRFAIIADMKEANGLKVIDLGAGHSSAGETLCGRILTALKSQALLNESVGAGYIERNWPPALVGAGAWPLSSLRQSFLNGSLTRLIDPDEILRKKICEFVGRGDFGLASGQKQDGTYTRVWYGEPLGAEEITFEAGVFLLTKAKVQSLKDEVKPKSPAVPQAESQPPVETQPLPGLEGKQPAEPVASTRTFRLAGKVPSEVWNRLGTKIFAEASVRDRFADWDRVFGNCG